MHLSNPALSTIKKDFKGNLWKGNQFDGGDYGSSQASFKEIMKWQLGQNPQRDEKENDHFRLKVHRNTSFITSDEDMVVWLGHSSFFVRLNGVSLLFDPCLKDLPMIKRMAALPCSIYDLIGIDYLLLSHGHRDHYDESTVNQLLDQNPKMELLLPLKLSQLLKSKRKKATYQEAAWWQQYQITKDIEVTFLPAKHWNRRYLHDFNRQLWGSFMIKAPELSIYFAGDSAYDGHFQEIKEVMGSPDVCMMPIGAYKPEYIMKEAHMNPQEAVQAFHDLDGGVMIPMHYGTYDLSDEPLGEPVRMLKSMEKKMQGRLLISEVGQQLTMADLTTKS